MSSSIAPFTENRLPFIYWKYFKHAELSKEKKMLECLHRSFPDGLEMRKYLAQDLSQTGSYKYLQNK